MSLQDFLLSIRTSAKLRSPTATVDSPKLDGSRMERILRGAHLWLTPKSVEGFDVNDFAFLPEEERQRLRQCVEAFRTAASRVPPDAPATNKDVQQALPPFRSILEITRPDKFGDADALVIGKQLEQRLANKLPSWVRDLRFETGQDASGDPAVWVWVIIDDEAAKDGALVKNTRTVRALLGSAIEQISGGRWPYIRFRTVSEQEEIVQAKDEQ